MNDPREFEEGMCNQDIEKFREQNGIPMNGLPNDDDDDGSGDDGVSCYY